MAKKRLASWYTFDASEKQITHADFSDIGLAGIQLIVNVTDNIIIYNFADPTKGGTLSTDTLTLTYDTSTMDDGDKLMILVEDGSLIATSDNQDSLIANTNPLGTPTTTNVTLTDADTDYKLPSSEKTGRRTIIISNNSAYDVYLGQTGVIDCDATTPIGILLPAGGSLTIDCSSGLYAQCDTAGVELTCTEF